MQLAAEHGAAEAARLTGVPAATIRSWRKRSGVAGPPAGVDPADWAARQADGANSAWDGARAALVKVRELLDAGKHADAQRAALTAAILIDKAGLLQAAVAAAEERQSRLDRATAAVLAEVLRVFCDGAGIPLAGCGPLLAAILRAAEHGAPLSPPQPEAAQARAAIRRAVEAAIAAERRELPRADGIEQEPAPMVDPEPGPDEVLDGEVVPEAEPPESAAMVVRRARPSFTVRPPR